MNMYLGFYVLCSCCIVCISIASCQNNISQLSIFLDEACEPQFEKLTNASSCYYISRDLVGGDEAFARCINIGGYLANFETLEEAMLMKQKLMEMNSGLHFFVGGRNINRRQPGGDWRWIKNAAMTKMTYFAFGGGEPDGIDSQPQDACF
ncbi:uncharacterized protein LOC128191577 [Crassostrea angulata]|uniref:uncharacterized protein LOC128191577 n=1 Tax=Magallana angulata TaxID=2784310 RepID=UPI0022B1ABBC|nr:uncharacterized protein LOC128191577 [Crassostrea angulata]